MRHLTLLAFMAFLPACKGDGPTETDTQQEPCTTDDVCGTGNICEPLGVCTAGDRSNDFDEALPIELEQEVSAAIAPEEDVDYWSFTSPGDEWVRIETVTDEESVNTVVSLFNPDKRLHAVMDDFPTGNVSSFDSVLHAYVPSAGTWTIKVEDRGTYYGVADHGEGDYTLQVKSFTGVTDETDAIDDPGATLTFDNGSTIYSVGVNVDAPGDDDFIEVGIPFDQGAIEVVGQADIPGSSAQVLVEVLDPSSAGEVLAHKTDVGPDGGLLYLDTLHQSYVLRATDADAQGGPDYWFVLYVRTRDPGYYPYLEEIEPNDTSGVPEVVDLVEEVTSGGDPYTRFDVTGAFDDDADEDWFVADVDAVDSFVTVWCQADSLGSLADPAVDVYLDDTLLASGSDGDDSGPHMTNAAQLDAAGQLRVRVYDESVPLASGPGAYYACSVFVTPFEVVE